MGEAGRLPLRERKKQQTYSRIVDTAFELFHTVGYHQTTMDAIADKAEVSRATLFNYFPTKQALLMPFANTLYQQRVQPEMRSYLETHPTTLQALHMLFMSIHTHVLTFSDLYRALQEEFFHHELGSAKDAGTGFFEMLLAILQYGKLRGEVRTDIPLENMVHYIGALYVSLLFHSLELQEEQQGVLTNYQAEIDTLLAFLDAALNPGAAQRKGKEDV
jgi:AcrR family transcriptional regulator